MTGEPIIESSRVSQKEFKELSARVTELERCLKAAIRAIGKAEIQADEAFMDEGNYLGIKFE